LADQASNPEQEAIKSDLMEHITRAVNDLPEKLRSVIIMRDIQDSKYELIAETMDLPLNTVKVYLHRGRKLLMNNLIRYSKHDFQPE